MLRVARRAVRGARLISVVDRAVMTRETSLILDLGREDRGLLDVTHAAHCVSRMAWGADMRTLLYTRASLWNAYQQIHTIAKTGTRRLSQNLARFSGVDLLK
jgi:hypothetical protein